MFVTAIDPDIFSVQRLFSWNAKSLQIESTMEYDL